MDGMGNVLLTVGVVVLVIAVCREITCWYFKFNAIVELLTEIRDLLKGKPAS